MNNFNLYVSTKNTGKVLAGQFASVNECVKVARSCYGKNVICEIVDNYECETVKSWTLRK